MKHYARVLTPNTQTIHLSEIEELLNVNMSLEADVCVDDLWECITISLSDGTPVCILERRKVVFNSFGEAQIDKLLVDIEDAKPETAVDWLKGYLAEVRYIYAFELLNGINTEEGMLSYNTLKSMIWSTVGGIIQEDNVGFTNEDGYYILRQFTDAVKGLGYMALLDGNGAWVSFGIDMGDEAQINDFCEGRVPRRAEIFG